MEGTVALASISATICLAVLWLSYRTFKSPFFLYLLFAGLSLALAAAASCFNAWPPAEALLDLGLASFGIVLAAASHQLLISFRLAGESRD